MLIVTRVRWIFVLIVLLAIRVLGPAPAAATTYYVSQTGNDRNLGTSVSTAFRTPQRGVNAATQPGDVVSIIPGSVPYGGGVGNTPAIVLGASGSGGETIAGGSCTKPITIEGYALNATRPVIAGVQGAANAGAIYGLNVSCIVIRGLELAGWNPALTWPAVSTNTAVMSAAWKNTAYTDYGLYITGTTTGAAHHITLDNLYVHDFPGGGIGFTYSDYVSIIGSIITANALYSPWEGSGISIYQSKNTDTTTTTHNYISGNFIAGNIVAVPNRITQIAEVPALDSPAGTTFLNVFANPGITYTQIVIDSPGGCIPPNTAVAYFGPGYIGLTQPTTCAITSTDWIAYNFSSDGQGIIVDDSSESQSDFGGIAYTARTLIINNITANNGGPGITCGPASAHCDIVFNTSYLDQAGAYNANNGGSPGAISLNNSTDLNVFNNIVVAPQNVTLLWDTSSANAHWGNNLLLGGAPVNFGHSIPGGGNVIGHDPMFVAPSANPAVANFQLRAGSPAIGAGSSLFTRNTDYAGNPVTPSSPVDIGAFQAPTR